MPTERGQRVMVWWSVVTMLIYGITLWLLFDMVPPPTPGLGPDAVAAFYREHAGAMKVGAMITSWVSAFPVPLAVVIAAQIARVEGRCGFWTMMALAGGLLMSIFLVLPPIMWGTAAYNADRLPEATALMHDFGMLTLVTTDQFYIFQNIAIAVICLTGPHDPLSPFSRAYGYFTIWCAILFEVGAFAFLVHSGPFAWNGLFVFWFPFCVFGLWLAVTARVFLRAIAAQRAASGSTVH